MRKTAIALSLSALAMFGCTSVEPEIVASEKTTLQVSPKATKQLEQLLDTYYQDQLQRRPLYGTFLGIPGYNHLFEPPDTTEQRAIDLATTHHYLKQINEINRAQLTGQDILTYDIFKRDREREIVTAAFPEHFMPLNQISGIHNFFPVLGSGNSAQPFNTIEDFDHFYERSLGFVIWMENSILQMREGITQNIVLPKPLVQKIIPQLQAHIVNDVHDSVFWQPVSALKDNPQIPTSEHSEIESKYHELIQDHLVPVYKKVLTFIQNEYLPNARTTVAYGDLPNGQAWYRHHIQEHTTLSLTAEEIHHRGQQEVTRILKEMKKVKQRVGFQGDLPEFFHHLKTDDQFFFTSGEEVVQAYTRIKVKINQRLPKLFSVFPKSDYEVREVEAFRAASAPGASYQGPALDGSRPGIFYINTHDLKTQPRYVLETLSIHEAAPGHHFQIALQQEIDDLPLYRRVQNYTVYAEGWALYAESLGQELGLFTDPYMWYGRLADEQLRAMRLVVDTGIHALGWSREQAINYMRNNSSLAEKDIVAEVERYIAWPGQALAYKTGEYKIRELRTYAEQKLGPHFDIKAFHSEILTDGPLPLPVLETKIKNWVHRLQH